MVSPSFLDTLATALRQSVPMVRADTSDSAVVRTPLPKGVGAFVRTVLNAPSWAQITAIVLAAITFVVVVVWIWTRRATLLRWLAARSRGWKIAFVLVVLVALTGAGSFGMATWNYTQHNNDFCIGCHVMGSAWTRFQHSEHRKLKCHDCHQQSLFASMRQLYLWVAERPNAIPPHAKVPTTICKTCHDQAHPDSAWKHVVGTAGHSVHLRNDKPALRNVQCVTCHGAEVHHFVPVDKTCGQAECNDKLQIRLGKMAGQTALHCTGCHNFTSTVADNLSPDSARVSLVPTGTKCLACHDMKRRLQTTLVQLDPTKEPHHGVCGACHNPHKQATTKQAFESCATAQCHARADTLTPFHRGLPKGALSSCGTCHQAHVWKVASKECNACHHDPDHPLRGVGPHKIQAAASSQSSNEAVVHPTPDGAPIPPPNQSPDGGPFVDEASGLPAPPPPPQTDTAKFQHGRHKNLPCADCHSSEESHGALTFQQPAGCRSCHHGTAQRVACQGCHAAPKQRTVTATLSMTVGSGSRSRTLPFDHDRHAKVECRSCHTTLGTLAPGPEARCVSCHGEHHAQAASCQTCHPATKLAAQAYHPRAAVHTGCSGTGCHADPAALALAPTRNVCVSCHREQADHKPGGDCASCHLVSWEATPAAAGSRR